MNTTDYLDSVEASLRPQWDTRRAIFSDDTNGPDGLGAYRYTLWRDVGDLTSRYPEQYAMFIGLNPSTATETLDDPTIRRCKEFSRSWGYGRFLMTNLFAFRATDPKVMKRCGVPVGDRNDDALRSLAGGAGIVIAAWGKDGAHQGRGALVQKLIPNLHCLKLNVDGSPMHPLYARGDLQPTPL